MTIVGKIVKQNENNFLMQKKKKTLNIIQMGCFLSYKTKTHVSHFSTLFKMRAHSI